MSCPAEKCLPDPASTMTFTASSSTARWKARSSAYVIFEFCALRYSGRSIVTTAVAPRTSYPTGSSSDMHVVLSQAGLEHLAGRVARQCVHELHSSRHLVVGQPGPAEVQDVLDAERGIGLPNHEREAHFAQPLVRYADDGRVGDAGQPGEGL